MCVPYVSSTFSIPRFIFGKYPDLVAAEVNPLRHYLKYGASEGAANHMHCSILIITSVATPKSIPHPRASGKPLIHFLAAQEKGLSPHPLFDGQAYLRAHPEAVASGSNALVHHPRSRNGDAIRGTEGSLFWMRFVILHYHFLKNAGTSIENILHRSFGGYFTTIDTANRDGHVSNDELLELLRAQPLLKAVSSHQIRYPKPCVSGFIFFDVCFLRDPIDRIRSMYDYFREKPAPGDTVSDLAGASSLGDFIARLIEVAPWYVNDAQVNLLANGIANDPPTEEDFQRAVAGMLRTSFLGVVDRFHDSLMAGQHFLRPVFPELNCVQEAVNVSGGLHQTLEERIAGVKDGVRSRCLCGIVEVKCARHGAGQPCAGRGGAAIPEKSRVELTWA